MVRDLLRSHHLLLLLLLRRKVRRLRHRLLNHRRQNNQRRHRRRRRAIVVVGEGSARCERCLGGFFHCGKPGMFDRDSQDLGETIVTRMSASFFSFACWRARPALLRAVESTGASYCLSRRDKSILVITRSYIHTRAELYPNVEFVPWQSRAGDRYYRVLVQRESNCFGKHRV